MRAPIAAFVVVFAAACGDASIGEVGGRSRDADAGQDASPVALDGGIQPASAIYPTIVELHEKAIARTCALNNGVCHSSKEYPDIHSLATLFQTKDQPCNLNVASRAEVKDSCETEGDHIVIAASGIDAEIARIELPAGADPTVRGVLNGNTVKLWFATPQASIAIPQETPLSNLVVRRPIGATAPQNIDLPGVTAVAMTTQNITLNLYGVSDGIRSFFDERFYPWEPSMARIADVNQNGVLGHVRGISLLRPGDPMRSYLVLRLLDDSEGDLMPRQCREWDERATFALGCWIEGLKTADDGSLTNALDPIGYDTCTFQPTQKGRCSTATSLALGSFEAVEDVIARTCGGSSCHIGQATPAAGMDLSPGKARASLISIASTQVPSMQRVAPGDPSASYLMCKVDPACAARVGQVMPLGSSLAPADVEIFRAWIAAGAP